MWVVDIGIDELSSGRFEIVIANTDNINTISVIAETADKAHDIAHEIAIKLNN